MSPLWRDFSGETFELPFAPLNREEEARLVEEARRKKEIEARSLEVALAQAQQEEAEGPVKKAARWFFDSPVLKPAAEAIRSGELERQIPALRPIIEPLRVLPGAISGGAALAGASIDQAPWTVPGIGEVISKEYNQGLPTALEQVAPVDITTLGLGAGASIASKVPRLYRTAKALSTASKIADITEAGYGGTQVVEGVGKAREGAGIGEWGPEVGAGAARLLGGAAHLIPDTKPKVKIEEPVKIPDLTELPIEPRPEDVNILDLIHENASGESAASAEAISRQSGMQAKGEQFVVYDRAGNKRPLIGPDAVDYRAQPGETYGVEGPNGFWALDNKGGKVPDIETTSPDISDVPQIEEPATAHEINADELNNTDAFLEELGVTRQGPEINPVQAPVSAVQNAPVAETLEAPINRPAERQSGDLNGNVSEPPAVQPQPGQPAPPEAQTSTGPKNYNEFLTAKFGERATTAKERMLAKAEWNRIRGEKKLIEAATKAGMEPEKIQELLAKNPEDASPEMGRLSALRRAILPVIDNMEHVHPWFKKQFTKYLDDAETPAMRNLADSWKIRKGLSKAEQGEVALILNGKRKITDASTPGVLEATRAYRQMLDQALVDARDSGAISKATYDKIVAKYGSGDAGTYFPHKFKKGWDDGVVSALNIDKTWNLKDPHLEKGRLSDIEGYRKDLDVLDEYFLSAYRRSSEVKNFGRRLELLRRFTKKHITDKPTKKWLETNIRRVLGREEAGSFDKVSGHVRHIQALSDLGLAAAYQPMQAMNTALYGGIGRSALAIQRIAKNYPEEMYNAIRSRALVPDITQEIIAGAYGAKEGITSKALQKFMWGVPTLDRWTRIHANTVGRMLAEDALKGNKAAIRDVKALGFNKIENTPEFANQVGKALSDKALFRTGNLEVPGWTSSTAGKLATQYTRFMYRHAIFVTDMFREAGRGNVVPLARFLAVLPTVIPAMAEVIYPLRESIRELTRQTIEEPEYNAEDLKSAAFGDESTWEDEIKWKDVLRNKRIPMSHPLKRGLQNATLWGGAGIFQLLLERALQDRGGVVETGTKTLSGPVVGNAYELLGSAIKDINALPEELEYETHTPGRFTRRWGARQIPIGGYPLARKMSDELWDFER
jgi:hypothetical protein